MVLIIPRPAFSYPVWYHLLHASGFALSWFELSQLSCLGSSVIGHLSWTPNVVGSVIILSSTHTCTSHLPRSSLVPINRSSASNAISPSTSQLWSDKLVPKVTSLEEIAIISLKCACMCVYSVHVLCTLTTILLCVGSLWWPLIRSTWDAQAAVLDRATCTHVYNYSTALVTTFVAVYTYHMKQHSQTLCRYIHIRDMWVSGLSHRTCSLQMHYFIVHVLTY